MIGRTLLRTAALAACVLVSACSPPPELPESPAPTVDGDQVVFPGGSPKLAAITTASAVPQGETRLRLNGRLVWDEDRTARILSPLSGRVVRIDARLGDAVSAGQALATIVSPELGQAQADARRAEQDHALAAKNLTRIEELHDAGVAATRELQIAQAENARTATDRARAAARLQFYRASAGAIDQTLVVRSPIAGTVVERSINPGQEVQPGAPAPGGLFVVSDPTRLWFVLDARESDLPALRVGGAVRLLTAVPGDDGATGQIVSIDDVVDPVTRIVKVRGRVENAERKLKAEMFVTAEIVLPADARIAVPTKAVFLLGDRHFVFVDHGGGRFERRLVETGPAIDGQQVLNAGLSAGERVVVDGALLLQRILLGRS